MSSQVHVNSLSCLHFIRSPPLPIKLISLQFPWLCGPCSLGQRHWLPISDNYNRTTLGRPRSASIVINLVSNLFFKYLVLSNVRCLESSKILLCQGYGYHTLGCNFQDLKNTFNDVIVHNEGWLGHGETGLGKVIQWCSQVGGSWLHPVAMATVDGMQIWPCMDSNTLISDLPDLEKKKKSDTTWQQTLIIHFINSRLHLLSWIYEISLAF